ncbi:YolD-like family protein [Bacillus massilinigeriensis]|uniref:YolD-like family protein n=1 Tax=Bacillus massilionigeriensis TaxID=1805475 RepID=UPI00096B2C69|nr:YolD-like family protein [Bacillus massilionigeriensis]
MIRDRGRMKWVSMMLPEHVKLLRDWVKEDTYEQRKVLDEQQWDVLNEIVQEAMKYRNHVTMTYYDNHRYEMVVGEIHHWDDLNETFHITDHFGEVHRLRKSDIVDVQLMEE